MFRNRRAGESQLSLRASEINAMLKAADTSGRGKVGDAPGGTRVSRQWPVIMLKNATGGQIRAGNHVAIDAKLSWPINWGNQGLQYLPSAIVPDDGYALAVSIDAVEPDAVGSFVALGVAVARVKAGSGKFGKWDTKQAFTPTDDPTNVRLLGEPLVNGESLLPVIIGDGAGGEPLRVFELIDFTPGSPGTGTARILEVDEATEVSASEVIYGNLSMFDDLEAGDRGTCHRVDGGYAMVLAPCPEDEEGPTNPTP